MTTKEEILTLARELVLAIEQLEEPAPPPEPIFAKYKVIAAKALARFSKRNNEKGFPIFEIYPGDSIIEGRIKYLLGDIINVYPAEVKGDSSVICYKMAEQPVAGAVLYLRKEDGNLI